MILGPPEVIMRLLLEEALRQLVPLVPGIISLNPRSLSPRLVAIMEMIPTEVAHMASSNMDMEDTITTRTDTVSSIRMIITTLTTRSTVEAVEDIRVLVMQLALRLLEDTDTGTTSRPFTPAVKAQELPTKNPTTLTPPPHHPRHQQEVQEAQVDTTLHHLQLLVMPREQCRRRRPVRLT